MALYYVYVHVDVNMDVNDDHKDVYHNGIILTVMISSVFLR